MAQKPNKPQDTKVQKNSFVVLDIRILFGFCVLSFVL